jgi:type I restriction enzyme, S subunit
MAGKYDTVPLGEVASIRSGFAFKSNDWTETGIPVVKIANVKDGRLVMEGCSFVPQGIADSAAEFALQAGDILIAMTGYIGDVARVGQRDLPAALNQRVGRFAIRDPRRLDQGFLFYLLRDADVRKEIEGLGYGSAQPNVSPSLIQGVEVPLPPLPEQRVIAKILGTLDDKIELNRRVSETLEAMARALFKSWFVDFDPVRAKMEGRWKKGQSLPGLPADLYDLFPARLVESQLGEIPEGWEVGALGDVAEHPRRGVQPELIAPDTPYIALEHMPRQCIALSEWGTADGLESNKFQFKKGEILFGKLRPYFHKVGIAPIDGVCSTDIVVVAPRHIQWLGFVLGHTSSIAFVEYTNAGSTGTKMPRTSWHDMARYSIALPPEPLVAAFTRLVQPSVYRIVVGIHESRTLTALRDTLLPKLISGGLLIRNVEKIAGAAS